MPLWLRGPDAICMKAVGRHTTLVVSDNKLRNLSVDALRRLENIDRLYLDGNNLERLPDLISKVI